MLNMHMILFYFTLISGTLIASSSNSWIITWTGLEVNLLALMPLMSNLNNKQSAEATIKYFLVQAMASAMFMFGALYYNHLTETSSHMFMSISSSFIMYMAIMLKIGLAPFHFWLPEVTSGSSWKMIFIVLTWQKLAPMMILYSIMPNPILMSTIIMTSSMISGIQGLNQTCMRKIMAYSSINHSSWMLAAMMISLNLWICYFVVYFFINLSMILVMYKFNTNNIKQMNNLLNKNKLMKITFMTNLLNLGGLPPFLGFLPKWLVIMELTENNFKLLSFVLIIFTLVSLYFYIRITLATFSSNHEESLIKFFNKMKYPYLMMNSVLITSLAMCTILVNYL